MGSKTKKSKAAGRFGAGYGRRVRHNLNTIESLQRKKQKCPFCSKLGVKREAAGIWHCSRCGRTFSAEAYYLTAKAQ